MSFNRSEVSDLLVKCHRRCCICHRFCGVKMETHHIEPEDDNIKNAIPVCFECHAEMKLYDDNHPRGRKYQPDELHKHKDQWLSICKENPNVMIQPLERSDVGPLQALIDEIEFNMEVTNQKNVLFGGCNFREIEFNRVISEGFLTLLPENLRNSLITSYIELGKLNSLIDFLNNVESSPLIFDREENAYKKMQSAKTLLSNAKHLLLSFLSGDDK